MPIVSKPLKLLGALETRWQAGAIDAALSTYDEGERGPGDVAGTGQLAPVIVGAQDRAVVARVASGGGVVWRLDSETDADIRGHELAVPSGVAPFRAAGLSLDASSISLAIHPASQRVVAVAADQASSVNLRAWWIHPSRPETAAAGAWVAMSRPLAWPARYGDFAPSAGVFLPSTETYVLLGTQGAARTSDWGTTWQPHATYSTAAAASSTKMGAAVDGSGAIVLAIQTVAGVATFVSVDQGTSFAAASPAVSGRTSPTCAALSSGRVAVGWVEGARARVAVLGAAGQQLGDGVQLPQGPVSGDDHAEVALTVIDDVIVAVVTYASAVSPVLVTSADEGATWAVRSRWWRSDRPMVRTASAVVGDRVLLAFIDPNEDQPGAVWLGGWTTIEDQLGDVVSQTRGSWCSPGGSGGLGTQVGGGTRLVSPNFLRFTNEYYYSTKPDHSGGSTEASAAVFFGTTFEINTALTQQCGVVLIARQGSARAHVAVYFEPDGFRARDQVAMAWLAPKVSVDLTEPMEWRMSLTHDGTGTGPAAVLEVFWRRPGGTKWSAASAATTTVSPVATDSEVRWGNFATGPVSLWSMAVTRFVIAATGTNAIPYFRRGLEALGTATTDPQWGSVQGVRGRRLRSVGAPLLDAIDGDDRAALLVARGPGLQGEVWTLTPRGGWPIDRLFPSSPSPSDRYRSGDLSAYPGPWRMALDFELDTRVAASQVVALVVAGCSVRRVQLRVRADGAGAFATLATLDLGAGFVGVDYVLEGDVMRPPSTYTGTEGARYIAAGELIGGHVEFDAGESGVVRRIAANTGGWWGATTGPRPALRLEGLDGFEPSSGETTICAPAGVVLWPLPETTAQRRRWAIEIDETQPAYADRVELGRVWLFGLHALGKQWDRGWTWRVQRQVDVTEDRTGSQRRASRGPLRRSVAIDWAHGVDWRTIRGAGADPASLGVGAQPLVARDAVFEVLRNVLELGDRGAAPVLLLGSTPAPGVTLTDPSLWLVGYVDSDLGARNVTGAEGVDEHYRLDALTILEAT